MQLQQGDKSGCTACSFVSWATRRKWRRFAPLHVIIAGLRNGVVRDGDVHSGQPNLGRDTTMPRGRPQAARWRTDPVKRFRGCFRPGRTTPKSKGNVWLLTFALEQRSRSFVNNSEQFAADLVDGFAERSVEHLRYTFSVVSTLAWPISCATTLPGTPRSCDHDEYVRRNVNQVARGSPSRLHAGKIERRSTLFGASALRPLARWS